MPFCGLPAIFLNNVNKDHSNLSSSLPVNSNLMKPTLIACLFTAIFAVNISAQQNLFGAQDIESAVVHADNSVTFRFIAPDAEKVEVAGDFAEKVEDNPIGGVVGTGLLPMTRDENGIWTLTTRPLESELYMYLFVVDGVANTDPNNPDVYRDFATISNIFIVGNGQGDLYKVFIGEAAGRGGR